MKRWHGTRQLLGKATEDGDFDPGGIQLVKWKLG